MAPRADRLDLSIVDVLEQFPAIARRAIEFFVHPRRYVKDWRRQSHVFIPEKKSESRFPGPYATAMWVVGFVVLVSGLYSWMGGPSITDIYPKDAQLHCQQAKPPTSPSFWPHVRGVYWDFGLGFGAKFPPVSCPNALDKPGDFSYRFGDATIYFGNVVTSQFFRKASLLINLIALSLATTMCFHAPAKLLGGNEVLKGAFKFSILFYSNMLLLFLAGFGGSMIIILMLERFHFHGIPDQNTFLAFEASNWFIVIPIVFGEVFLIFRTFILSYSELYIFSKSKCIIALLISGVISSAISPIIIIPLVFLIAGGSALFEMLI